MLPPCCFQSHTHTSIHLPHTSIHTHTHAHSWHITVLMCLTAACKNPSNLSETRTARKTEREGCIAPFKRSTERERETEQASDTTQTCPTPFTSVSSTLPVLALWVCVLMIFCTQLHNLTRRFSLCPWIRLQLMWVVYVQSAHTYIYIYIVYSSEYKHLYIHTSVHIRAEVDIKLYGLPGVVNAFGSVYTCVSPHGHPHQEKHLLSGVRGHQSECIKFQKIYKTQTGDIKMSNLL